MALQTLQNYDQYYARHELMMSDESNEAAWVQYKTRVQYSTILSAIQDKKLQPTYHKWRPHLVIKGLYKGLWHTDAYYGLRRNARPLVFKWNHQNIPWWQVIGQSYRKASTSTQWVCISDDVFVYRSVNSGLWNVRGTEQCDLDVGNVMWRYPAKACPKRP